MGIFGVILGIVAVLCGLLATFLFGTTGAVIAAVIAAAAIALGVLKRKKDGKGGAAAIAIGVIAIVLAFSVNGLWTNMFTQLHEKALELKPDGLWAQASENVNGGIMSVITRLPADEASMNALMEEMQELSKAVAK